MALVTHGYGGDWVVEMQGWPDVMAAVVRDVWGLVTCLLEPGDVWGTIKPCRDCGCTSRAHGCDQGALAHMGHTLHVVGMWHAEVSSCFLYGGGKGHGEGIIGMVHALVHCVCYFCVSGHVFYWQRACIRTYICCACLKESDLKGWTV